jgi:23S rRNA pseudouridine2605 synthase
VEREYAVRVLGALSPEERVRLLQGVPLPDGAGRFERLEPSGAAEGANRWYRVVLREGRNREVRRLFEAVGRKVSRLLRVRYGPIELPRELRPGRWAELGPEDVARIVKAAKSG